MTHDAEQHAARNMLAVAASRSGVSNVGGSEA